MGFSEPFLHLCSVQLDAESVRHRLGAYSGLVDLQALSRIAIISSAVVPGGISEKNNHLAAITFLTSS